MKFKVSPGFFPFIPTFFLRIIAVRFPLRKVIMNSTFRRITLGILIFIVLLSIWKIMLLPQSFAADSDITAERGVIDARSWNFEEDGPLPLRGEWIFLHSVLLSPKEFIQFNDVLIQEQEYISVPGFWNLQIPSHPAESYGTFVLQVLLPQDLQRYGLYIQEISSAYTLYIDSERAISTGMVGTARQTSSAKVIPRIWSSKVNQSELNLLMHVSNYQATKGGIWKAPLIGTPDQIFSIYYREVATDLFLFGSILMMALYHLGIYSSRRRDQQSLFFALFCIMIALRGILTGARFMQWAVPWMGFEFSTAMEFVSVYAAAYFYYRYHILKFPGESWRPFLPVTNIVIGFLVLSAFIMPVRQHANFFLVFEIYLVWEFALILGGLGLAMFRHRAEALVYAVGFSILVLASIHDILHYNLLVGNGYLLHYALWIFILLHSYILARHFASMERKTLNYAASLETLTTELQEKIRKKQ